MDLSPPPTDLRVVSSNPLRESSDDLELRTSRSSLSPSRPAKSVGNESYQGKSVVGGIARHTLGLVLLLIVVFLWTASNFLGSVGELHVHPQPSLDLLSSSDHLRGQELCKTVLLDLSQYRCLHFDTHSCAYAIWLPQLEERNPAIFSPTIHHSHTILKISIAPQRRRNRSRGLPKR